MVVKLLLFGKCTLNHRTVRNRTNRPIYAFEKSLDHPSAFCALKSSTNFSHRMILTTAPCAASSSALRILEDLPPSPPTMESRGDIFLALLSLFFQMIFFNHDWGNANFFFSKVIPVFGSYRNILVIQVMKICDFLIFFYK